MDENKALTYEEAKRLCRIAFDAGADGADGVVTAPSGCDWLRDRMRELGVVE